MSTPPANPQENIELRVRTIRTLWFAMFLSVGMYYVFTFFVGRSEASTPNNTLFLIFVGISLLLTLVSFPVKNKLVNRAIEQQQVVLVQQAYILAMAITEVPALLGLLDFFATGNPYFYVLFIISALGQVLHFPRREHVVNASSKTPIF